MLCGILIVLEQGWQEGGRGWLLRNCGAASRPNHAGGDIDRCCPDMLLATTMTTINDPVVVVVVAQSWDVKSYGETPCWDFRSSVAPIVKTLVSEDIYRLPKSLPLLDPALR